MTFLFYIPSADRHEEVIYTCPYMDEDDACKKAVELDALCYTEIRDDAPSIP